MKIALAFACALGLASAFSQTAFAEEAAKPKAMCIDTFRIDHLSYPDDKTILFHMVGGPVKIYRNDLPRVCQGLKFEQGIAWNIWGGQVCSNMQIFYVLRRGTPCMLGSFSPYTPPEKKTTD